MPNSSASTLLPINRGGSVEKLNPLTQLPVTIKNNVDVFYFSINVPMHVLFAEDGKMGKNSLRVLKFYFLQQAFIYNIIFPLPLSLSLPDGEFQTNWGKISAVYEAQGSVDNVSLTAGIVLDELRQY